MERKVLLHTCCAPCSLSCIGPLREEGLEPVAFWYNPNIHPWKEYEARRDCLLAYAPTIGMEVRVLEEYGLREFVRHVAEDIAGRCTYCYEHRLETAARYAAENGFSAFTTTLLASTYQQHDNIAAAAKRFHRLRRLIPVWGFRIPVGSFASSIISSGSSVTAFISFLFFIGVPSFYLLRQETEGDVFFIMP